MSLTSQIKDASSPIRRFFSKFENKEGSKECLALLQSTKPILQPQFTPTSNVVYAFIGTTTDYLIRYTAGGNSLVFENTIAHEALKFSAVNPISMSPASEMFREPSNQNFSQHLVRLYQIGTQYLDGRDATDREAVYSATALAVMDNVFRSGRLPQLFSEPIPKDRKERIKRSEEKGLKENKTRSLFDEYYETLGGKLYAHEVSELVKTFVLATRNPDSELFNARFVVFNQALGDSKLIGGADFDCVIEYNKRLILTDIKTTTKPLSIEHFRQIVGYALLYNEKKDNFRFTDVGIYHSRSGSFRFLPIARVIEKSLPSFKSISLARKAFISEIQKT